jgi:hypothetical protein
MHLSLSDSEPAAVMEAVQPIPPHQRGAFVRFAAAILLIVSALLGGD